tara:strand:- start:1133 stop:1702 length:570 start_codon:yes stop_codon:yes gene_type:complete
MEKQVTTDLSSVQVWDNYLDDGFLVNLDEDSNHYSWQLNNVANRKSFPYKRKGSHLFWSSGFPSLEKSPKNISNLYNFIIKEVVQSSFNLEGIMLNGQSLGQNGTTHIDNYYNDGYRTLMVFINHKWQKEWGGEFQLLEEIDNNSKIIKTIEYIPGRIIIFDGNIPHRGLSPIEPYILRKSLIFRLKSL